MASKNKIILPEPNGPCPMFEGRQIGFEVKALNNMIRRRMEALFAQQEWAELSGMQGPLIGFLYQKGLEGPVYQRDVEREFHIRRSTATVTLQSLEQKGYIVRVTDPTDARLKSILLTDKAKERRRQIDERILAFHSELEAGISEEEKEAFLATLDKLMKNLGAPPREEVLQQEKHRKASQIN